MLDVLFQADLLVQIIEVAVDPDAGIAAPPGGVQLFLLGALRWRTTGASTWNFVPSSSLSTASTISSTVCWLMTLPQTGQCGMPMRAYSRRR